MTTTCQEAWQNSIQYFSRPNENVDLQNRKEAKFIQNMKFQ